MKYIQSRLYALMLMAISIALPSMAWADGTHKLTVKANPAMAGSFNIGVAELASGKTIHLYAYANSNFSFVRWKDESGAVVSEQMDFIYTMPDHDILLTAEYEYNPANPANPLRNYWNKLTGEVIIDDFITGSLQNAVRTAIGDSKTDDVTMITIAGVVNNNDFGIANTYSKCTLLDLSRVTGFTQVPSYAFDYTNLESVYLPATIEEIGAYAFYSCSNLAAVTVYAMIPPTLGYNVFSDVPEGLVVYVPAATIAQYQDDEAWGKYTLLPIQEDVRDLSVSLPEGTDPADFSQMWLELINTKSGQRMHYVMTERVVYTFANIIRNTSWNVVMRNERGDIFGRIDDVEVKDKDVAVTFPSLSKPQTVSLSVLTPDGQDVTTKTQITWLDASGNYLAQGASLAGLPVGYRTSYRMALPQDLAMTYITPQQVDYTLTDGDNKITCQLVAIPQVKISGKVKDATTGMALSGATISASQTFDGKYSKTLTTKTDGNGVFTLDITNVPTSIAFAASDYISQTLNFSNNEFNGLNEFSVPEVLLKSITGATISLDFTYTACATESEEAETQNWYSDYANVAFSIYNETQQRSINDFNVQYPQIVLLEEVDEGDVLKLTATSRTTNYSNSSNVGAFMPVTAMATIDDKNHATATFNIVQLGQISASFNTTENAAVAGILYDSKGKLISSKTYSNANVSFTELEDGDYTLVSMAQSTLFNSVYDLAQLPTTGLKEGTDYVQNEVTVQSGVIATVDNDFVPYLDESKLYYTGDNTSFTVNKPSIVAGNYLTLTGHIDFKPAYATNVSNVQLIVDLPESCEFVENSVMVGNSTSSYTLNGNQITIPMARYTDRVRFCVIPTLGGDYAPSAFVQFDFNGGTVNQPIGSANYTAKDLSISVPSTVAKTAIPVSGTAIGTSNVEIYDNDVLIGQTTSLANGTWATTCELNEPYNLSKHQIYAKVTTKQGIELTSENVSCAYDMNAIQVSVVKMYHDNPELHKTYELTFDFLNPSDKEENYIYYIYNKMFTFTIDFTNNDTTKVSDVVLYVKTAKSGWHPLEATYDTKQGKWVAASEFGNMYDGDLPVNVSVEYHISSELVGDRDKCQNIYNEMLLMLHKDMEINLLFSELQDAINQHEDYLIKSILNTIEQRLGISLSVKQDEIIKELTDDDMNEIEKFINSLQQFTEWAKVDNQCEYIGENGVQYVAEKKVWSETEITMSDLVNYYPCQLNDSSCVYLFSNEDSSIYVDPANDLVLKLLFSSVSHPRLVSKRALNLQNLENFVNYWSEKYDDFQEKVGPILEGIKTLQNLIDLKIAETLDQIQQLEDFASLYERGQYWNKPKPEGYYRSKRLKSFAENSLKDLKYASKVVGNFLRVFDVAEMLNDFVKAISSIKEWIAIIRTIESIDCPNMDALAQKAQGYANSVAFGYGTKLGTDIGALATADKLSKSGVGLVITAAMNDFSIIQGGLNEWNDLRWKANIRLEIPTLKCTRPKPGSNSGDKPTGGVTPLSNGNGQQSNNHDKKFGIDPSGYVYEGVATNRIEGVTSTIYYKENVEDMYGDLHENIVKWDAAEYAQENPLFTDENGMYRWDVPQGLWQVKFEKEGYETTYSEWLPVPPPQLDVNIPMVQSRQPEVKAAHAYEDGVEVEFDKYMMPESLTPDNIKVTRNGENVEGTVELLDEEVSYEGKTNTFASRARFVPANDETLLSTDEIVLTVSQKVKSYAGLQMQESYTQAFDVEKAVRKIVVEEQAIVPYEGEHELLVSAQPYDAAVGKTLKVKTASKMIADVMTDEVQTDENGIMEVTLDEDGQATLTLTGELPGATALTFSIEDANVTAQTMVSVKDDSQINTKAPVASRASGSALYSGTEITLSSKTGSAVIYYTLDGSCPCDETTRIKYDGPIVVTGDMTIKAMAQGSGMYESDVVTFTYTIKKTKVDVSLQEGWNWISHNMAEAQDAAKVFKNATEVKSQTKGLINDAKFGMVGNLRELLATAAYKVKTNAAESIVLSGNEFNAGANAISLKKGWNWIGFPVNQTLSLDEAFAKSSPQEGDYITGQKGYAEYLTDGGWIGTLEVLTPGKGYMYQSTVDNSITYNTALVSNAKSRYGHAAVKRYVAPWAVNIYQYPNIMPVTADLFVDGVKADADAYTVAAFCGTECRGVGQYVKGVLFLSVYGDGNENITFYASDNTTDEVYDITEQMPFAADRVGSYNAPFALHVGGKATEIAHLNAQFKVSPTVAHDGVTVTLPSGHIDRLTVVSTGGVPVLSQHNLSVPAQINVAALPEGIYIVVAVSEGKTYYNKIVKVN